MNSFSSRSSEGPDPGGFHNERSGARTVRPDHVWRPFELLAMVLGFVFFWPVGLAVIGFKIWQRRSAYPGDLQSFLQDRLGNLRNACSGWQGLWEAPTSSRESCGWSPFGGMRPTGNRAFDEWRASELARLEAERRKLEEAEREFAVHIEELRRARDREEFERFMNARHNRSTGEAS